MTSATNRTMGQTVPGSDPPWREAIATYQQALAENPNDAAVYNQLAEIFYLHGSFNRALACCDRALTLNPQLAIACKTKGSIFQAKGQLDEAQIWFEKAIQLEPGNEVVQQLLETVRVEKQYLKEAELMSYRYTVAVQSDSYEAHHKLGHELFRQGRWDEAISEFYKAIELNPTYSWSHQLLGESLTKKGHFEEAIPAYLRAIELNPNFFWSYHYLGEALAKQGRHQEAIAAYEQAIQLNPSSFQTHHNLGHLLFRQGLLEKAKQCFQTVIQLSPDYSWSHQLLGEIYARQSRLELAIASYRQAIQLNPNFAWSHHYLALALVQLGYLEDAFSCFQKALELRGWSHCAVKKYQFTKDWFTPNIPHWQNCLQPFANRPHLRMLEIGSHQGMSTCWLLDHILTHPTARITCIDLNFHAYFDVNIAQSGASEKVTKLTGDSHSHLRALAHESYDIIYIDGCHLADHVRQDAALSWTVLKENGVMIFDDYAWKDVPHSSQYPKIGIDAFLASVQDQIQILHKAYQVVIKRVSPQSSLPFPSLPARAEML